MSKACALACALSLCPVPFFEGCKKDPPGAPQAAASGRSPPQRSRAKDASTPSLTKEEVGAIIGEPVTEIDGKEGDLNYKTADMFMEARIDLEQGDDADSAIQSMEGAHTATKFLGGTDEAVPGLGDEAFFGGLFLHVRKGSNYFTVMAPNLQQQAESKALKKFQNSTTENKESSMQEFIKVSKGDPMQAGLQGGDPMQAALAAIKASSKKQGTEYEAKSRAMAVALAKKLVEKL